MATVTKIPCGTRGVERLKSRVHPARTLKDITERAPASLCMKTKKDCQLRMAPCISACAVLPDMTVHMPSKAPCSVASNWGPGVSKLSLLLLPLLPWQVVRLEKQSFELLKRVLHLELLALLTVLQCLH